MKTLSLTYMALSFFVGLQPCVAADPLYDIDLTVARQGFDKKMCWVHARAGAIPGKRTTRRRDDFAEADVVRIGCVLCP